MWCPGAVRAGQFFRSCRPFGPKRKRDTTEAGSRCSEPLALLRRSRCSTASRLQASTERSRGRTRRVVAERGEVGSEEQPKVPRRNDGAMGLAPWTDTKTCHTAESATLPVLFQQPQRRRTVTPGTATLAQSQTMQLGFKPFEAFAPQRRARPAALPPVQRTRLPNGFPGDFQATQRLAEPIMRPDYYKLEQFVPLLRTW
jgi:hypothetical protein